MPTITRSPHLLRSAAGARACETLATLRSAGPPLVRALRSALDAVRPEALSSGARKLHRRGRVVLQEGRNRLLYALDGDLDVEVCHFFLLGGCRLSQPTPIRRTTQSGRAT